MDVLRRNNVKVSGRPDGPPMVFAHGFGCDQNMWRFVAPAFEATYRVVLFDHVGAGGSDLAAYDRARYDTLHGYAEDVLEICRALDLQRVVFVGHSVSAMIGVLAAIAGAGALRRAWSWSARRPATSTTPGYVGGFSRAGHRRAARVAGEQLPRLVGAPWPR